MGVVSGAALVALSLGALTVSSAQAQGPELDVIIPEVPVPLAQSNNLVFTIIISSKSGSIVETNIGLAAVSGGGSGSGDQAQVRLHLRMEDNVQYQFNFNEAVIIRDEDHTRVELKGWREKSGEGRAEATATVIDDHQGEIDFLTFSLGPPKNERISFRTKGSIIIFEEPDDPRQ